MPAEGVAEHGIYFVTAPLRGASFQVTLPEQGLRPGGFVEQGIHFVATTPLGGRAPGQSVFKPTRGRGPMFHSR